MKSIVTTTYGALSVITFSAGCLAIGFILGQLLKAVLS